MADIVRVDTTFGLGGNLPGGAIAMPCINAWPAGQHPANGSVHASFFVDGSNLPASPASGYSATYITTATTTNVANGGGLLARVIYSGATASATLTIYDSTTGSGPVIWSGVLQPGQMLELAAPCNTGATLVTGDVGPYAVYYGN